MSLTESTLQDAGGAGKATGVMVVNLGTPDEPTAAAVRRYLKQFLSDPRVVEAPRWLWWPVLNGFILRVRPRRSAAAYRKIWTERGSPLLLNTLELASELQASLSAQLDTPVAVAAAMNYGEPSIDSVLDEMLGQGMNRILVLPLYPQYAGSTTGSVFDRVSRKLSQQRWVPELRFINHYYDEDGYIAALAQSIRDFRGTRGSGERLLMSFHGLPRRMVESGDPYLQQCLATARRVAEALGLSKRDWQVSFQSRVGAEEWLRPYTDETLREWGRQGMEHIDVICPGFAADCLETLEEIAMQNTELYAEAGGGALRYIPCLNASAGHVSFLSQLVAENLGGWLPTGSRDLSTDSGRFNAGDAEAAR